MQVDLLGHNGLLHAAQYGQSLACYFFLHLDRFVEGVPVPARAGGSLNTPLEYRDHDGHTALHWACYQGHLAVARYLLQEGAALAAADAQGCTPLHWAANRNHPELVQFLVDEGADARAPDAQGETPEACAVRKQALKCLPLLRHVATHPTRYGPAARAREPAVRCAAAG